MGRLRQLIFRSAPCALARGLAAPLHLPAERQPRHSCKKPTEREMSGRADKFSFWSSLLRTSSWIARTTVGNIRPPYRVTFAGV